MIKSQLAKPFLGLRDILKPLSPTGHGIYFVLGHEAELQSITSSCSGSRLDGWPGFCLAPRGWLPADGTSVLLDAFSVFKQAGSGSARSAFCPQRKSRGHLVLLAVRHVHQGETKASCVQEHL